MPLPVQSIESVLPRTVAEHVSPWSVESSHAPPRPPKMDSPAQWSGWQPSEPLRLDGRGKGSPSTPLQAAVNVFDSKDAEQPLPSLEKIQLPPRSRGSSPKSNEPPPALLVAMDKRPALRGRPCCTGLKPAPLYEREVPPICSEKHVILQDELAPLSAGRPGAAPSRSQVPANVVGGTQTGSFAPASEPPSGTESALTTVPVQPGPTRAVSVASGR